MCPEEILASQSLPFPTLKGVKLVGVVQLLPPVTHWRLGYVAWKQPPDNGVGVLVICCCQLAYSAVGPGIDVVLVEVVAAAAVPKDDMTRTAKTAAALRRIPKM